MMWWAICAVVVASSVAAPASDPLNMDVVQIDPSAPDDESLGYALQSMGGRYAAPWVYLLADMPHDTQVLATTKANKRFHEGTSAMESLSQGMRLNRERRSFTVNAPVEHLQRNALLHYIGRVAQENRDVLNRIGKRDQWTSEAADAFAVHRLPHVGASPETEPREGAEATSIQQELPQRYW